MRLVDLQARPADAREDARERAELLELLRRLSRESDLSAALRAIDAELRTHFDAEVSLEETNGDLVERVVFDDRELATIALRRRRPFDATERERLSWFASLLAPTLARLTFERDLEEHAAKEHTAIRPDLARLFRGEALEQYQRGRTDEGHPLELEPAWTRHTYRLLLALFVVALLFSLFVRVDRHADGVGIVRGGRLVALLPARDRTALHRKQPLSFEYATERTAIATIDRTVVAATAARQLLGEDGPRLWRTTAPAIRIDAPLPSHALGDGVTGRVRVQLGRERLLFVLIPPLRDRP
ncbi:MAG TPA: hypothetical protein VHW00_01590 [Thermoanaerobaculia bacterium]|nr:hypothetical protein [Thermoanaerobaculia bacterium]